MKRENELPPDLRVDILVYKDHDLWVAHCLQLDVAVAEPDRVDAMEECINTCSEHLAFAIKTGRVDTAFKMAPPEVVNRFLHGHKIGTRTITVPLLLDDGDTESDSEPARRRVDFQQVDEC
jgi:hypothetical protein